MKTLITILTLISSIGFAAIIEPGIYQATDVDSKTITATLNVRADSTANLHLIAPDFVMPEPGCEGTYAVQGNLLKADMHCPLQGMENVKVTIDITNVTAQGVLAEPGVIVDVVIDSLGAEAYKFYLRKLQ